MDELDKALKIAIVGPEKDKALKEFRQQVSAWGLALPAVEPLVLDFGLGDFRKVGLIEMWIANEAKAGYCGKYLFVFDGQTCPLHHHRTKVETFCIVQGRVSMEFDGATRTMKPGDVLFVEAGRPHSFTGNGPALLLEISKPCQVDDNYFRDTRIPIGGNYKGTAK